MNLYLCPKAPKRSPLYDGSGLIFVSLCSDTPNRCPKTRQTLSFLCRQYFYLGMFEDCQNLFVCQNKRQTFYCVCRNLPILLYIGTCQTTCIFCIC